jgi:hypothetical protein
MQRSVCNHVPLTRTFRLALIALFCGLSIDWTVSLCAASGFEGYIRAVGGRTGGAAGLLYTVGTNFLRVEMTDTNHPNAVDIFDLRSGQLTLVMPHNRSFMRFQPAAPGSAGLPPGIGPRTRPGRSPGGRAVRPPVPPVVGPTNLPGMPAMPAMPAPPEGLPAGIGPQAQPPAAPETASPPNLPAQPANAGMASPPAMPMVPPGGGLALQATGQRTNLLNCACERYEIKQRAETMEIWATDQLVPFQVYLPAQPPGFGPPLIEHQWSGLLTVRKLFPLRAVLKTDNGVERYRFEVQSITPGKLTEREALDFQPPEGYVEIQPSPF